MNRLPLLFLFALMSLFSCLTAAAQSPGEAPAAQSVPLPAIPDSLRTPALRADWLISHFWDVVPFGEISIPAGEPLLEQGLVDFISVLPYASSDSIAASGFANMALKASVAPPALEFLTRTAEIYLINSDSPMASEPLYIRYLSGLLSTGLLSEAQQFRAEDKLETVSKNLPGTKAADFSFTTLSGDESSLFQFIADKPKTMVIFFDPDCENCGEVMARLQQDASLLSDVADGRLAVLAVYAGPDTGSWRRKAAALPEVWTVGINVSEIDDEDLYYFPSLPTLYYIAPDATVLSREYP